LLKFGKKKEVYMAFWDFLTGGKDKFQQLSTQSPQQQQFISQIMSALQGGESNIPGMEWLQSLFSNDPDAFAQYEAPALRQFNEQIIPGIAERFTGMGAGGRGSSAFNNASAMAGARLSENLAAQRANLRGGAMNQLQGWGQIAQQPQFENIYMRGQPGLLQSAGQGIGQMIGLGGYSSIMNRMNRNNAGFQNY